MTSYKNININLRIFYLSVLVAVLAGCRSIYTPTTPNVPLFKEKNEFQTEVTTFLNGYNLKTAYTPIRYFAVQINGQFSQSLDKSNPDRHYHKYLEGAIGYYHCFKDNFVMECYGGYGQGKSNFGDGIISDETLLVLAKGHYEKYYIQLNFGTFKVPKKGRMGICVRAGNVRYTYAYANLKPLINTTDDHYLIEPYWFMNVYMSKRFFFTATTGITIIQGLSTEPYQATMRTNLINIGVGFKYILGRKKHAGEGITGQST